MILAGVVSARGRPMSNVELASSLADSCADLRAAMQAHLLAFGTLIPHVFMGDVLAHVRQHSQDRERLPEVGAIIACLEQGMEAGGRETCNVITISFLREAEDEPFFASIVELLGPRVRAQLRPVAA